jgi:hypothetical protein
MVLDRRSCRGRWAVFIAASWLAAHGPGPRADEVSLPCTVAVEAAETYLRAGPGDDFYPTERLARGDTVEIWAIDESGYCAVRPPNGSYSRLRACDVAIDGDPLGVLGDGSDDPPGLQRADVAGKIGVVVTDGAIARVGSQLNDLRHVTQVALEAGERVRLIGHERNGDGRHAGDWVRVEPPSGEFRWARGEDLALPEPLAVTVAVDEAAAGLVAAGAALDELRATQAEITRTVAELGDAVTRPPRALEPAPASRLFAGWLPLGTAVFDSTPAPPTAVSASVPAASADELAEIDLALSLAVAGPSDTWNLSQIRERLRLVAARAATDGERTRAQAIDARLSRFEEIQSRQQALVRAGQPPADAPLQLGGMWSSLSALGSRPIRPGVLPGGGPAGGQPTWTPPDQVETTGRLATVVSRRPDAPRWALVDERNNVLTFVTPQAGVNLAPLVGQQVSVRGARGYMPEYKRPYLVATQARTRIASVPTPSGGADRTQ